jgi:hypothetical protein
MMDIGSALTDPQLFEPWFRGPSWDAWRAVLRAAFGEKMTKAETRTFRELAKRDPPASRVKELWAIAGMRCGKDSIASGIAAHAAASFRPGGRLRPGERVLVACLAVDRSQASIVLDYARAFFAQVPSLKALVRRETSDGFELENGVDIAIATNDYRSIRGRTILCVVCDEVAFWKSESTTAPDFETYRAVRRGMLTLPESMLIGITSPHRRAGLAYERWAKHFGRNSASVLVIQAASRQLNSLLPQSEIDEAMAEDAAAARADFYGEWRDDLASFVTRDLIEAVVEAGVGHRDYDPRRVYVAFIDASSGRGDSFTCAVAHREGDVAVLDFILEVPSPFDTTSAVAQVAAVLRQYRLGSVMGDNHAVGFVIAELLRHNIRFEPRPTGMDRSVLYLETLPLFSAGTQRVRLLDNKKLIAQYAGLERRTLPSGHERVDHPIRGHDDLSNACSGALWRTMKAQPWVFTSATVQQILNAGRGERAQALAMRARDRIL